MSFTAQECLDSARKCGLMASQTKDGNTKEALIKCVRQWLELARQKTEALESALPKPDLVDLPGLPSLMGLLRLSPPKK